MKTLEELQKERDEITKKQRAFLALNNMSEDETSELDKLNAEGASIDARVSAMKAAAKADKEAESRRDEEMEAEIAKQVEERFQQEAAKGRRLPSGDAPYQSRFVDESKYDHMDTADLALFIDVANAFKAAGQPVQPSPGAYKALSRRVAKLKDDDKDADYVKGAFKRDTKSHIEPTVDGVDAAIKAATDPMYTGGSGIGTDWVGTAYATELWQQLRDGVKVLGLLPTEILPDGYSNKTFPLEGADFTVYKVAETTAANGTTGVPDASVTASQVATANKNITIAKLGARGMFTEELNEDSLVGAAAQLREQITAAMMERLESAIIDGDTETSANKNINDIAGTPAATDYFLVWDGFRKLPLVTNTANSRSAAGGFVIEDYKDTLKLLGTAGLGGSDPSKVGFIQDFNVMWAAMELPEVKTKDVFSAAAIEEGRIQRVYRVPVIDSFFMHMQSSAAGRERKANTAGKIDVDTTTNNTTGSLLAVRFDQWKFVYKRRLTIETTRFAESDSWQIVALARAGLGYRDTEASAITYNIGV